ncbi:DUF1501 domain-containing protein [Paraburkholderia jirisanensis]
MKRREFLSSAAAASAAWWVPRVSSGAAQRPALSRSETQRAWVTPALDARRVLILIELKGGNDGLNTVIPFADPAYRQLRPQLAVPRDAVLQLDERTALHPSLQPLLPIWQNGELAIVQGLGYAQTNFSHFRSSEIWHTASDAQRYLRDGWLTRAFAAGRGMACDERAASCVVDGAELGPLGGMTRAALLPVSLATIARPAQQRALPELSVASRVAAMTLPTDRFGASIRTALEHIAATPFMQTHTSGGASQLVVKLTLNGFDTHANQRVRHAALLAQLAGGCAALRAALLELGWWRDALIVTYSEFGREARENDAGGTGHGSSAPHFVMGDRVRGGLYGAPPALSRLDGNGNLPVAVDFRRLYATLLGAWWGIEPGSVLERRFEPLPLLKV